LIGRSYRALADGAAPPISVQQVLEVNRLVSDLKPQQGPK
jgi:hypothetical protein